MNKYKFLSQFTFTNSAVVPVKKEKDFNGIQIPNYWLAVFKEKKMENKLTLILDEWEKYLETELSNTIEYLSRYLKEVEFVKIGNEMYLLYTILSYQTSQKLYYVGGNPFGSRGNIVSELDENWNALPFKLRLFYEGLHNGFYYLPNQSMGLDKTENIENFEEFELPSEFLEGINLENTFNFFSNGAGGYVALDITDKSNLIAILWRKGEKPLTTLEFWDLIDDYYIVGFDE